MITDQNIDITQVCQECLYASRNQSTWWAELLPNHNQFYAHDTEMFRARLKANTRLLGFSLTGETPSLERIAFQNICMRFTSRLGELCS